VGGIYSINPGNSVYGASKSAFNSMMRFCAKELAVRKIRVNSVNPGMVETPLIHGGVFSEEDRANDIAKYPLGRYGQPGEVACGIIYLLSEASAWVTGTSLVIDGGLTI
jgi:NAD(P)-dependent dehydrogenase (short-subunit alcohol dehydrogenase family)